MEKDIFKLQLFLNHVSSAVLLELILKEEFVKFVTSSVQLVLVLLQTVFLVLLVKFSTREDVGLNAQQFLFRKLVKMHHVLIPVLMDSTKYLKLNVLHVLSNAQLAQAQPEIVPHVFMDQSQQMDHVQLNVDRMNLVSEASVLPAQRVAMDVKILLKTVLAVPMDMSKLDLSVKKDVFLINSMIEMKENVLPVDLDVLPALLTTSVLPAKTLLSAQEEVSAPTVLILVLLVMELELVHHVSVDSSTSKDHARLHVLMELLQSMEFVNVNQESFLSANV